MHNWRLLLFGVFVVFEASESFSDRGFVDAQRRSCDYRPPGTKINENLRFKSDPKTRGSQLTCQEQTTHQQGRFMSRTAGNDKLVDQRLEARRTLGNVRFINQQSEARRTVENGKFVNPLYKARTVSPLHQERIVISDQTTTEDAKKNTDTVRESSIKERSLSDRNTCEHQYNKENGLEMLCKVTSHIFRKNLNNYRRITEKRYLTVNMKYNSGDGKIRSAIRDAKQVRSRDINDGITKKSRNVEERRALSRTEDNNGRRLSGERRTVIRIVVRDARQVRSRDAESGIIRESRNVEERRSLLRAEDYSERRLSDERRSATRMVVRNARHVRSRDTYDGIIRESRNVEERRSLSRAEDNSERKLSDERRSAIRMVVRDARQVRSSDTDAGITKESRTIEEHILLSRYEDNNEKRLSSERLSAIRMMANDDTNARSRNIRAGITRKSHNVEEHRSLSRAEYNNKMATVERRFPIRIVVRDNRQARSQDTNAGIIRESRNLGERRSLSRAEDKNERRFSGERHSATRVMVRDAYKIITKELCTITERENDNERRLSSERRFAIKNMVSDARHMRSRDIHAGITRESRNVEERRSLSRADGNNERRISSERRSIIRMVVRDNKVKSHDKDAGINRESRNVEERMSILRAEEINERTLSDKRRFTIRMVLRDARQVKSQGRDAGIKRDLRNDERHISLSSAEDITERRLSGEKRSTIRIIVGDTRQKRSRDAYAGITRESRKFEERRSLSRTERNNEMRATGEIRSPIRMVLRDTRQAWSQNTDAGIIKESLNVEERRSFSHAENQNERRSTGERRSAIRMMLREAGQQEALINKQSKTLLREDRNIAMQMKDFTQIVNIQLTRNTLIDSRNNGMRSRVLEKRRDLRQLRDIGNNNKKMNKKTRHNSNQRNFQSFADDRTFKLDRREHDPRTHNNNEYQLEDISIISSYLPATLYILQVIYVCSILMYIFGASTEKKVSRTVLWYTSKFIKVD